MNPNPVEYFQSPEFLRHEQRRQEIQDELYANGTSLINAIVQSSDVLSAELATEQLAAGEDPKELYKRIGSYARFGWAVKHLPKKFLYKILPELWVSADPDDTNDDYLKLWQAAFVKNGRETITDGKSLPKGRRDMLTVYRGQVGQKLGISWTLDRKIAVKFALCGGGRGFAQGGEVIQVTIPRSIVLAYLTGRGESEVIFNPTLLQNLPRTEINQQTYEVTGG
jgi:hypothetical protein